MAESISTVDITGEQQKFPDFIGSFMPDKVPVVPDDFFYDEPVHKLINNIDNETNATVRATINIVKQEIIDDFIYRDIMLANYPNYRKLNLLLGGLTDIINYKDFINIEDNNIYNYREEFNNRINEALSKITTYPNPTSIAGDPTTDAPEGPLTDIKLTEELQLMIGKSEEIISLFKLFYNDTDFKTTIYDLVLTNQFILGGDNDVLKKLAALSDVGKTTTVEQAILTNINKTLGGGEEVSETTGAPTTVVTTGAPPLTAPVTPENPFAIPGLFARGGSTKNKTYKRTIKRSKRSKSKRRSQ